MASMRGDDREPDAMFSYVSAEQRVPKAHPLRAIRALVDEVLRDMSREFDGLYARVGRPSIPPERLLRAQLLQIFYSIRSERLLMEQLDYNLLFRWFVGMAMDEPIWAPTVFSKNRDRLLNQEIARSFFRRVVDRATDLMSDEHFTVDGTLIEAWASQKSFQRKDGDTDGDGRHFSNVHGPFAYDAEAELTIVRGLPEVSGAARALLHAGLVGPVAGVSQNWCETGRTSIAARCIPSGLRFHDADAVP